MAAATARITLRNVPEAGEPFRNSVGIVFVEALAALQHHHQPDGLGVIGGETAYQLLNCSGREAFGSFFRCHAEVIVASSRNCRRRDGRLPLRIQGRFGGAG